MARQAGLGKSLHEVLEALTPAESLPDAPRLARAQLELELDQLIEDVHVLRERVQQLSSAMTGGSKSAGRGKRKGKGSKGKGKRKSKRSKKKSENEKSEDEKRDKSQ